MQTDRTLCLAPHAATREDSSLDAPLPQYSRGAVDFDNLARQPAEYRDELVRLMAIQAYAEQKAATEGVSWIANAPDFRRRRIFAKVVAEEAQHSALIYQILERIGVSEAHAIRIAEGHTGTPMHEASLEGPLSVGDADNEWIDIMLNHMFLDRAGKFMVGNYCEASFLPWAEANRLILRDEAGHVGFGLVELRTHLAASPEDPTLRDKVRRWYVKGLNFFGPPPGRRAALLQRYGLKRNDNETLRQSYRAEVEQVLTGLGKRDWLVLDHDTFPFR